MVIIDGFYTDIEDKKELRKVKKKIEKMHKRKLTIKGLLANFKKNPAKSELVKLAMDIKNDDLFLVTYPLFSYGLLEIYSYKELLQRHYYEITDRITVIGFSDSKGGAMDIVSGIMEQVAENGFDANTSDVKDGIMNAIHNVVDN